MLSQSTRLTTIFSVKKGAHFSLDDVQKCLSLEGKMVITRDLAAFTQVSSCEGHGHNGMGENIYCLYRALEQKWPAGKSQFCGTEGHLEDVCGGYSERPNCRSLPSR